MSDDKKFDKMQKEIDDLKLKHDKLEKQIADKNVKKKKEPNNYIKFGNKMRPILKKKNPGIDPIVGMQKLIAEEWNKLSDAQKKDPKFLK